MNKLAYLDGYINKIAADTEEKDDIPWKTLLAFAVLGAGARTALYHPELVTEGVDKVKNLFKKPEEAKPYALPDKYKPSIQRLIEGTKTQVGPTIERAVEMLKASENVPKMNVDGLYKPEMGDLGITDMAEIQKLLNPGT